MNKYDIDQTFAKTFPFLILSLPFVAFVLATQLGFNTIVDEHFYHLKAIQKFSSSFPHFPLKHYSSVTGPLPYMLWATFGKVLGFEICTLRFLTVIFSYLCGLLFFITCREQKIPFPLLKTFILIFFPYIFLHSFTLYTINVALFWQIFSMLFLLRYVESKSKTDLTLGAIGSFALIFSRQIDLALPLAALCFLLTEKSFRKPWNLLIALLPILGLLLLFIYWGSILPLGHKSGFFLRSFPSVKWTQFTLLLAVLGFYFHPVGLVEMKRCRGGSILILLLSIPYLLLFPIHYPKEGLGIIYYGIDVLGRNIHKTLSWILPLYFGMTGSLVFCSMMRGAWKSGRPSLVSYILLFYLLVSGFIPAFERYYYFLWPIILLLLPKEISENRKLLILILAIHVMTSLVYIKLTLVFPK